MIPGGIADKLGNGYEAYWALYQAMTVLHGQADEMRIEPFDEDASGFEFRVTASHITRWHQCKSRRSNGTWTIRALTNEGVLEDFARKLETTDTECIFISADPAAILHALSSKARLTDTEASFAKALNQDEEKGLLDVAKAWSVSNSRTYQRLRRCHVETISQHTIRQQISMLCSLLFSDAPEAVVPRLLDLIDQRLTQTMTTESLRRDISDLGLSWRARLDPSVEELIKATTQSYLSTLQTNIRGTTIATTTAKDIAHSVFHSDDKFLIVAGTAGCGKSSTISALVAKAENESCPVLAFRIDRLLLSRSIRELGDALFGRPENPVATLGNRFFSQRTILLIDQIDAVSEASGRSAMAREHLFEMLHTAEFYPNMKIVLACRSYDLENDARLTLLEKDPRTKTMRIGPLDWDQEVFPLLKKFGLDQRSYNEREQRLLSLPLNLKLLCEIAASNEAPPVEISASRLFDQLLAIRAREIREAGITWTPATALGAIASMMSSSQDLTAPAAALNAYSGAVEILSSAGLISCVQRKIQFAHESFFDHVFSDKFLTLEQPLTSLLRSTEQKLFRRTQVRQIFARLRDQGVNQRYLTDLSETMNADDVRYLVKDAIATWLASVEQPTRQELHIARQWFAPDHPLRNIAHTIFAGEHWFQLLAESKAIQEWLSSGWDQQNNLARWLLRRNSAKHPTLVVAEIRQWWDDSRDRLEGLLQWFSGVFPDEPNTIVEDLYFELVESCSESFFVDRRLPELNVWAHRDSHLGARVLGHWLRRWFALFPDGQPFTQFFNDNNGYWITEIAKKAPQTFLDEVLPTFIQAIERDRIALLNGDIHYSELSRPSLDEDDPRSYPDLLRHALRNLATSDPNHTAQLLELLPLASNAGLYLYLETIAANGETFAQHLLNVLHAPDLLDVGVSGTPWASFAAAASSAMPYLQEHDRLEIERRILRFRPEYESTQRYLKDLSTPIRLLRGTPTAKNVLRRLSEGGFVQRAILHRIGSANLSTLMVKHLQELDRKFLGEGFPEAHGIRGGWVQSPIAEESAERMSDAHWLLAMHHYSDNKNHIYKKDFVIGGRRELAHSLESLATKNADRFLELLRKIPLTINAAYPEAIISGLSRAELSEVQANETIRIGLTWPFDSFKRTLCWFIERHPSAAADAAIIDFLFRVAEAGTASDTIITTNQPPLPRERSLSEIIGNGGDLESSGLNSERGAAYNALAKIIWRSDDHLRAIIDFTEKQLLTEPLNSVRMHMVELLYSISKYDVDAGIAMLLKLAEDDPTPMNSRASIRMLRWATYNYPERMRSLVDALCGNGKIELKVLGLFLLSGMALSDDQVDEEFRALWKDDIHARRIAAYRGSGNLGNGNFRLRCEQWLVSLFSDAEQSVRKEAARCKWDELLDGSEPNTRLVESYINSPAFDEHTDRLLSSLSERIDLFPQLAISAVRRTVAALDKKREDRGYWAAPSLGHMLVKLYRTVEGDTAQEKHMLDLFDEYLSRELHDMRSAISEYERD